IEAQRLGRTVSSLIEQTATWKKLGFTTDESSELAKISSIYANVGEVSDDTAVSDLVTAMKAFNIESSKSITIVDSLNKLGNEFATDAGSLGEGLKNAASALALGGMDINKSLALLTGGSEITQNAGELGNALKVGQMRVMGMKGALEQLGEESEGLESISKIQTHILNITKGQVNIMNEADPSKFKDYYDILESVSKVYFSLKQTDQADLLETLFGKQRGNQGAAILQALEASMNSTGSAYEEQSKWMESIDAKSQQYEASFQSLSQTVLNSNFLKFLIDSGTTFNNVLDKTINGFGILSTTLSGAGIAAFIKNYG
ncbi:MAG TPA: phage tail tape measure protein, partial [Clostridium sp.]|nr:phage tail tape measure protein [Clostridium sp.]